MSRICVVAIPLFMCAACGGSPSGSNGIEIVTGVERFGWDQPAADAGELVSFRYAFYVDDVRSDATDVSCATGQAAGRFVCTAALPSMSTGTHALQVASFVVDGGATLESARSVTVRVQKR
jgi:hypothetical protein